MGQIKVLSILKRFGLFVLSDLQQLHGSTYVCTRTTSYLLIACMRLLLTLVHSSASSVTGFRAKYRVLV